MLDNNTLTVNLSALEDVGNNLKAALVDGKLILVIDANISFGYSSTGKMKGYGSTGGFASMPGGFKGNVYVGKKA